MSKLTWSFLFLSGSLMVGAAHAQPLNPAADTRITGVGCAIAAQGNAALAALREQLKHEIRREISDELQAQLAQMLDQKAELAHASTDATVALITPADH